MKDTDKWLSERLAEYTENPTQTLCDMLYTTNNVIEQYLNSPNIATKGLLESCLKHNKIFLEEIDDE